MPEFEFALGEVVVIDPSGKERGPLGRVVGQIIYDSGSTGYLVSHVALGNSSVIREILDAQELHRPRSE